MDEILTDYVSKSGEPTTAGSIPWIVAKEASQLSKVAVIANGADELFFGYNRLRGDSNNESMFQNNHLFRGSVFDHYKLNRYRQQFDGKPSSRMTDLMNFVQYDINRTLDFASMCHSIEMRSPFLSSDVISQALSIRESEHTCEGNKTILKRMLWDMGFREKFINRPKQGFSLFQKPNGTKELQNIAYEWCIENGYLNMDNPDSISERDKSYLKNSALGFYYFYQLFKHKIK
jgi:asparagine synthetase B (glutamine-hydrolysing)